MKNTIITILTIIVVMQGGNAAAASVQIDINGIITDNTFLGTPNPAHNPFSSVSISSTFALSVTYDTEATRFASSDPGQTQIKASKFELFLDGIDISSFFRDDAFVILTNSLTSSTIDSFQVLPDRDDSRVVFHP